MLDDNEMYNRFSYHKPGKNQTLSYHGVRNQGRLFAELINRRCPDSREKSIALTKIEEAVMWANAAIARNSTTEFTESQHRIDRANEMFREVMNREPDFQTIIIEDVNGAEYWDETDGSWHPLADLDRRKEVVRNVNDTSKFETCGTMDAIG